MQLDVSEALKEMSDEEVMQAIQAFVRFNTARDRLFQTISMVLPAWQSSRGKLHEFIVSEDLPQKYAGLFVDGTLFGVKATMDKNLPINTVVLRAASEQEEKTNVLTFPKIGLMDDAGEKG